MIYQRILVAIDGSEPANQALHEALRLAKDQRALLRILHVVDDSLLYTGEPLAGVDPVEAERDLVTAGQALLAAAEAQAHAVGLTPEIALLETDGQAISAVIVEEAKRWPTDLMVLGTHGRHGLTRLVLGSVAEAVAERAPVPVLLVRGG